MADGCTWTEFGEHALDSPLVTCTTGKPALFYNCNQDGPVCEEHVCRCRPSLLTERTEEARRAQRERFLEGARKLRSLDLISARTFELILRDLEPKPA